MVSVLKQNPLHRSLKNIKKLHRIHLWTVHTHTHTRGTSLQLWLFCLCRSFAVISLTLTHFLLSKYTINESVQWSVPQSIFIPAHLIRSAWTHINKESLRKQFSEELSNKERRGARCVWHKDLGASLGVLVSYSYLPRHQRCCQHPTSMW